MERQVGGNPDDPGVPAERLTEVWTVRLTPSDGRAVRNLARAEQRELSDMLRLLIGAGYAVRTAAEPSAGTTADNDA